MQYAYSVTLEAFCMQAIISATGNSQVDTTCSLPSSNPHYSFMFSEIHEILAERYILKSIIELEQE